MQLHSGLGRCRDSGYFFLLRAWLCLRLQVTSWGISLRHLKGGVIFTFCRLVTPLLATNLLLNHLIIQIRFMTPAILLNRSFTFSVISPIAQCPYLNSRLLLHTPQLCHLSGVYFPIISPIKQFSRSYFIDLYLFKHFFFTLPFFKSLDRLFCWFFITTKLIYLFIVLFIESFHSLQGISVRHFLIFCSFSYLMYSNRILLAIKVLLNPSAAFSSRL